MNNEAKNTGHLDAIGKGGIAVSSLAMLITIARYVFDLPREPVYFFLAVIGTTFFLLVSLKLFREGKPAASCLLLICVFLSLAIAFL